MSDLVVPKMRFAFADHPVPFLWNPENPAFSNIWYAAACFVVAALCVAAAKTVAPAKHDELMSIPATSARTPAA